MRQHRNTDVHFDFVVGPHGWARAKFEIGEAQLSLLASYMTDALGDLIRAALALAGGSSDQKVVWVEEPGCSEWVLIRDSETLRVQIVHYDGLSPTHLGDLGVPELDASCSTAEFLNAIYLGADAALSAHGPDRYKELWRAHEFPVADLGTLGTYVAPNND
jgi:hypothetical protein